MDEYTRKKLKEAGRPDLIEAYDITESGYAGINHKGTIVDRRKVPESIPVQKNPAFNIPEPEKLTILDLKLDCDYCNTIVSKIIKRGMPDNEHSLAMLGWLCPDCGRDFRQLINICS